MKRIERKTRFQFADHPWISMIVFVVLSWVLIILFAVISTYTGLFDPGTGFALMIFVVSPFVMRIPRTKHSFSEHLDDLRQRRDGPIIWLAILAFFAYCRDYLAEIRLTRVRPIIPLLLLGLSCWVILAFSQGVGTIVFRLTQGKPLTAAFILSTFSIAEDLPPQSTSLFTSFWSIFEEIVWRGIFLSLFLGFYSKRKAVIMAALGFSILHLINLSGDRPTIWVMGQLVWSFILGLWYGYSVIKTDSLIPAMIVHWLGNAFIYSITNYLQHNASPAVQALYGVIFTLGIVPTVLMTLWVRYVSIKWPVFREVASNTQMPLGKTWRPNTSLHLTPDCRL
jgi:membrane protease YdiL (CAAX protease family)